MVRDTAGYDCAVPLSNTVRERCRQFLRPGDRIRYLFPAMSVSIGRSAGTAPFLIVVAETEVLVLACGWFRRNSPQSVWARHPGTVRLGPIDTDGSLEPTITLGELVLQIDDEYAPVVMAADTERLTTDQLPADPFPDL
jgi:hypothetical protein